MHAVLDQVERGRVVPVKQTDRRAGIARHQGAVGRDRAAANSRRSTGGGPRANGLRACIQACCARRFPGGYDVRGRRAARLGTIERGLIGLLLVARIVHAAASHRVLEAAAKATRVERAAGVELRLDAAHQR